jgi:hypothetical protein
MLRKDNDDMKIQITTIHELFEENNIDLNAPD